MDYESAKSEFPELAGENLEIWNANAAWWDDRIGDGNEFQTHLIEPASERLLDISAGDYILDIACGAGRFARRHWHRHYRRRRSERIGRLRRTWSSSHPTSTCDEF